MKSSELSKINSELLILWARFKDCRRFRGGLEDECPPRRSLYRPGAVALPPHLAHKVAIYNRTIVSIVPTAAPTHSTANMPAGISNG
jgi:hypothetical protein